MLVRVSRWDLRVRKHASTDHPPSRFGCSGNPLLVSEYPLGSPLVMCPAVRESIEPGFSAAMRKVG